MKTEIHTEKFGWYTDTPAYQNVTHPGPLARRVHTPNLYTECVREENVSIRFTEKKSLTSLFTYLEA